VVRTKSVGGVLFCPPNGWSKTGKSNLGVYLRFRSNLLYQKFLMLDCAAPQARRKTATARGQKISSPQPPPFFARSPWPNRAKRGGKGYHIKSAKHQTGKRVHIEGP